MNEHGTTQPDKQLLDILVCPKCRTQVEQKGETLVCSNPECRLIYPIRDGIPVMLIDEATRGGADN